jgi:DNA-binding MarR family transcriptional regulator
MDATGLPNRRPLHALLAALKPISDRDSHIRAAWIKTLLMVALDEGKGVAHYSREAKVRRTIMSRNLHCIGDKKRGDDNHPGLGLVEVKIDPVRADRRQVFLTEEGHAVVAAIIAQFRAPRKIS